MTLTSMTPVQIDTQIADIETRAYAKLDSSMQKREWAASRQKSLDEGVRGGVLPYMEAEYREAIAKLTAEADDLKAKFHATMAEVKPFDAEFARRGGWSRYILVQDGHIHRHEVRCSTLRPTTRVGWLPQYSGKSASEMIEDFRKSSEGAATIMCTVCFPDAPVAWTVKPEVEGVCTNKSWDANKPKRTGYYTGNYATCSKCGTRATLTGAGNLRKHKIDA